MKSVSEQNKLKVRLFVEAVWNQGRLELIDELIAANYTGCFPCAGQAVTGPEGVRRLVASQRSSHPCLFIKIEDQIAEDELVVTRWRATTMAPATTGPAAPTPTASTETGQPSRAAPQLAATAYAGISVIRLLAGKQVESVTECTRLPSAADRELADRAATCRSRIDSALP